MKTLLTLLLTASLAFGQKQALQDGSNVSSFAAEWLTAIGAQPTIADGGLTLSKLSQSGATTGQSVVWNGSAWAAATVASNLTSGPVTSSAGVSAIADGALSIEKTSGLPALLRPPVEAASMVVLHDSGGVDSTLIDEEERLLTPGPGTVKVKTAPAGSLVRYENGDLIIAPGSGIGATSLTYSAAGIAAYAGLTMQARLTVEMPKRQASSFYMMFSSSYGALPTRGGLHVSAATTQNEIGIQVPTLPVSDGTDNGWRNAGYGMVASGEEIALCVHYKTTSHQQYYMQGGRAAEFGCTVGSNNWFLLDETYGTVGTATVYPMLVASHSGVFRVSDVKILSSWSPGSPHTCHETSRTFKGIHIPSIQKDPVSGLMVQAWNSGLVHYGATANINIKGSVRLPSGAWTTPEILQADSGGDTGYQFCHLSTVNGKVWMVYVKINWATTTYTEAGPLFRRELTINATTGAVTVGAEVALGIGDDAISFSSIVETDTGRFVLPYQADSSVGSPGVPAAQIIKPRFAYSDDDGITWSTVAVGTGVNPGSGAYFAEQTITKEANGALGAYIRTADTAWYTRSTDNGTTWSQPTARLDLPMPGSFGSRLSALNLPEGGTLLVGNNHQFQRRNVTIRKLNNSGVVMWEKAIGDLSADSMLTTDLFAYTQAQYPCLALDGNGKLLMGISLQHGSNTIDLVNSMRTFEFPYPFSETDFGQKPTTSKVSRGSRNVATIIPYQAENRLTFAPFVLPATGAYGPQSGEQFVVGSKTYTWRGVVSTIANEVLIGATPAACITAAIAAINDDTTQQSLYGSLTTENTDADAITAPETGYLLVRATSATAAGYSVGVSDSMANAGWDGTTLQLPSIDLSRGSSFAVSLTGNSVVGTPINPLPWEEMTLVFIQGGSGSFTATFNAVFEFGGITPVWRTAVNATNTLKAYYNPITNKWVLTSWN
jgi:hypothetical protein